LEFLFNGRFFLGKNKVMQVALGKSPETEPADNTHLMSKVGSNKL
jgi:hypothetical protein